MEKIQMSESQPEKRYNDGVLGLMRATIAKNRARPIYKKRILTGLQSRLECTREASRVRI
jgi:hypothetical protein